MVTLLAVLAGAAPLLYFNDDLPPRTPQKVARLITGLPLPRRARVLSFEDEWMLNGDGSAKIVLALDPPACARALASAPSAGYHRLARIDTLANWLRDEAGADSMAWVRVTGDVEHYSFSLGVVDPVRCRVTAEVSEQ